MTKGTPGFALPGEFRSTEELGATDIVDSPSTLQDRRIHDAGDHFKSFGKAPGGAEIEARDWQHLEVTRMVVR